jgi:hypothetical protein
MIDFPFIIIFFFKKTREKKTSTLMFVTFVQTPDPKHSKLIHHGKHVASAGVDSEF